MHRKPMRFTIAAPTRTARAVASLLAPPARVHFPNGFDP
jgi:hypothetical protein